LKYCANCVLPDTRPGIVLDEVGVCGPCSDLNSKQENINWEKREQEFQRLVAFSKHNSNGYDCLIPVSGGKDSTWQVVRCLEHELNPLAVTWKTPGRTKLGSENLDNLVKLGVDHIDYQVNPKVERLFMLKSLIKYGSTAVPMHMAMFNIPLNIAEKFKIPLVIWGENSAQEYGAIDNETKGFRLTKEWLRTHGNTFGTTAVDWVDAELTKKMLTPYYGPSPEQLEAQSIQVVFLGHFFKWDPEISFKVASDNGFKPRTQGPKTGYYNYADIDDEFMSIHHYIKWYKFGCTRLFDNLSIEIRNGRMTRSEAIKLISIMGEQRPDDDIKKLCEFININEQRFNEILETFRNRDIWFKDNGAWKIKDFIVKNWEWK